MFLSFVSRKLEFLRNEQTKFFDQNSTLISRAAPPFKRVLGDQPPDEWEENNSLFLI